MNRPSPRTSLTQGLLMAGARLEEIIAHARRVFDQSLLDQDLERRPCATAQARGLPPKVLAVVAGHEDPQDTSVLDSIGRHRVEAAGQRLSDEGHVGLHALVFLGQQFAGPTQPGLDLVQDQDDVVAGADVA